jgi:hypothetical protein
MLANVITFSLSYFIYSYLALSSFQIKNKFVRFIAVIILHFPILLGYITSTIGVLALVFIIGDEMSPPVEIKWFPANLRCEVKNWGMAASDSGRNITLYQSWSIIPFLEKQIDSIVINETNPKSKIIISNCEQLFAEYNGN